ncbi:glycosyltransferase 87 family protein [[Mycobacterium] burgundiense]|uniref:Glycosyltransferase 87 family protein n=1 Tax=[Mycobacterium] burgundiense TaxID=3064286 RepID=A0ABM9LNH5_9MYCO|nr:glycosyltransferase 87 family protein [Mycolicibacterium sp. MU0053]CAJ1502024.1 glycosyltransferase 87 family protein [Mycolicibacterium sp. MU0053]
MTKQRRRQTAWRVFQLATVAAFGYAVWRLFAPNPYRIDIDVYRMGGRAWLDSQPLYSEGATFHTVGGIDLPFTYPPLSAVFFSPFAWLSLPAASIAITATTLVLLVVATMVVLTRLDVLPSAPSHRWWVAAAITAPAVLWLEPLRSNFDFGQINVVLMTLVLADCVPRRTPWPRGMLLGLAIALKLTPAVFLLYFVLRRDGRALLVAAASFVVATLVGFAMAWQDSIEYWTTTVVNTDRIGTATLNTNQNISGALARLGLGENLRFVLWVLACFAVLGLTAWAVRRILTAGSDGPESVLALMCVALFGLVVSPVSWSHHWVWVLPTLVVTAVLAVRHRNAALGVVTAAGLALMIWTPIDLLPEHQEADAAWWRQLLGGSYIWWAVATILVAGLMAGRIAGPRLSPPRTAAAEPTTGRSAQALHPL